MAEPIRLRYLKGFAVGLLSSGVLIEGQQPDLLVEAEIFDLKKNRLCDKGGLESIFIGP